MNEAYPHQKAHSVYRAALKAPVAEKPQLVSKFFETSIRQREAGELKLYLVGYWTITLMGSLLRPGVVLIGTPLEKHRHILEELYEVSGRLDIAAQGGSSHEQDEADWARFKELVEHYDSALGSIDDAIKHMTNTTQRIEETNGPERMVFQDELKRLTQSELEELTVTAGIHKTLSDAEQFGRELLEVSAAEAGWPQYFYAHRFVMGSPSRLDPDQVPHHDLPPAAEVWRRLVKAPDPLGAYVAWARRVVEAVAGSELSRYDAAAMLIAPDPLKLPPSLESNANYRMVSESAGLIQKGINAVGFAEQAEHKWQIIALSLKRMG